MTFTHDLVKGEARSYSSEISVLDTEDEVTSVLWGNMLVFISIPLLSPHMSAELVTFLFSFSFSHYYTISEIQILNVHLLASWSWTSYLILSLSFLTYYIRKLLY